MTQLIRIGWGAINPAFRRIFASLFVPDADAEQIEWYANLQSKTTNGTNAAKIDEDLVDLDVPSLPPEVSVPSLRIHSEHDTDAPFNEGQRLAQLIPNSKFVKLPGRDHILSETELARITFISELKKFRRENNSS
jgi:pimeloyl-ACP methyl ester carboxylesterase